MILLAIYVAGVIVGLIAADEPFPRRIGVAASWPLGPLAFVAVISILMLALPIAMPRAAAALAVLAAAGWFLAVGL